jgi:2'-5' RNA ligase
VTFRAFIAVDLEAPVTLQALGRELTATGAPVRVVDLRQLHLTLKFLGDTPEPAVPDLVAGMRATAAGEAAFDARLAGVGALPSPSRPRVVYVGFEDGGRLAGIVRRLEAEFEARDFARDERRWLPHATLARVKGSGGLEPLRLLIERNADADFGTQRVTAIRLKKSVLSSAGPAYSDVAVAELAGRPAPGLSSR